MARPVEIDRDAAFEAALELFWRRGYGATSMSDLLKAMQISSSSFYAAFGSKPALFLAALDRYSERAEESIAAASDEGLGLDALRTFLLRAIVNRPAAERRRGCLLINSVLELEGVDDDLYGHAVRSLAQRRKSVARWLSEASSSGQLRTDIAFDSIVDTVELAISGLRVASREGAGRTALRRRVDTVLALITAPEAA